MKQAGQLTSRNSTHSSDNKELQLTFVEEEFYELLHAWNHEERKDVIKEATDVLWVTYGLLHLLGVDPDVAFDRLYSSNLSKLPFTYKDGKVQKGKNYVPPTLSDL